MTRAPGETLRRALTRLGEARRDRPDAPLPALVDAVALELDLDAASSEWLLRQALRMARDDRENAGNGA